LENSSRTFPPLFGDEFSIRIVFYEEKCCFIDNILDDGNPAAEEQKKTSCSPKKKDECKSELTFDLVFGKMDFSYVCDTEKVSKENAMKKP
jgi:hypothetical protein